MCTSCEASVVLGKQFPSTMTIRRLWLSRKARKLVFAMFIWRLSSIFDLGLCVLIGQSELSTLCPVPGLLINSPGYEVGSEEHLSSAIPMTSSSRDIYFHTPSGNHKNL